MSRAGLPPQFKGAPGTAMGRPPGTASRLMTAMNPGTARPGTMAQGGGIALNTQVKVVDRPMTQQGLGGMKTGGVRGERQIQDKSFFLGKIRGKMTELTAEIVRMSKEVEGASEEASNFLTYEKKAESLASEIRDLQGELGDYNTLVDKLNTDEDIQDVDFDFNELKAANAKEASRIEELFEMKQGKEAKITQLETELDQEKRMADNMVNDMDEMMREKYLKHKDLNEHLLRQLESGQQELDKYNTKIDNLQEELSMSKVKQEAVRLYEQLHELEAKRDSLVAEALSRGDPAQEREKLLKQVKEDNQEIASMDRQTNEIREKISQLQDEIQQLDMDIEENQGERSQKYKELKKRDETMEEFMSTFDEQKGQETERITQMEQNITAILEQTGRNLSRFTNMPSTEELTKMKEDLKFKEGQLKQAEYTVSGVTSDSTKLERDLAKVNQLETKINAELVILKEKIGKMDADIEMYSNLDSLRSTGEDKRKQLAEDRAALQRKKETFKKIMHNLTAKYDGLKAQLNDNETYTQLGNLERKWQHHEQNNFVMKEFIAAKTMECDYRPITKRVYSVLDEYHTALHEQLAGKTAQAM